MNYSKLIVTLFLVLASTFAHARDRSVDPCAVDEAPLLTAMFSNLGHDCAAYASLFTSDARYYHQHDGYKVSSELLKNCQGYAAFCPGESCRFLQNGSPVKVARGNSCHILVPYVWSEMPANNKAPENLEPHTGFEYIVATPNRQSRVAYSIKYFAEIESSYSVAFNWADPEDTPDVVKESTLHLLSLGNSASKGECNSPIAPVVSNYFRKQNQTGNTWRQQGDAVVLAAGGLCHVAVPYAAQLGSKLRTGHLLFTLQPTFGSTYQISNVVEFAQTIL